MNRTDAPMQHLAEALSNDCMVVVASGDALDVRSVTIQEGISTLFRIALTAVSRNQDIDFGSVVGREASVTVNHDGAVRKWTGTVEDIVQERVETTGVATYSLSIVPKLWLATQRKNYRVFQYRSELDIAKQLLGEHRVAFTDSTQRRYPPRKFVVQYGESDFAFLSRMLESIGVAYAFELSGDESTLVLADALESRISPVDPLPFFDTPPETAERFATKLTIRQRVRPGRVRIQDLDYRKPATSQPVLESVMGLPQELTLEQMEWQPGAFLYQVPSGDNTPAADDRGVARTDTTAGAALVHSRLLAARASARGIHFETGTTDLVAGSTLSVTGHPHREIDGKSLLITRVLISGSATGGWRSVVECATTDQPFRPPLSTPKPRIVGVESAVVVGPPEDDIHTDEFARVRVQFHWDRQGARDERSSCWVPVNQPWGGAGFGAINLPRVGQEVLIEFLGGDPDRPVIMGRVFTKTHPTPYKLPQFKDVSGIRSNTSPRLLAGGSGEALGAGSAGPAGAPAPPANLLGGPGSPLDLGKLGETMTHPFFDATSPDRSTLGWDGNELSFCDRPGSQQVYLQAQRDMREVVKNSSTSVVGNARSSCVGTDDILYVGSRQCSVIENDQSTAVHGNRSVSVVGTQSHSVGGNITVDGKANQSYTIAEKWDSRAKIQEHTGEQMILLTVGSSQIVMRPEFIIIQGDDVFINPGPEDTRAAIEDGTRPKPEHERQAEAAAAHAAASDAYAAKASQMFAENQAVLDQNKDAMFTGEGQFQEPPVVQAEDQWQAAKQAWESNPTPANALEAARTQTIYDMTNMPGTSTYDGAISNAMSTYGLPQDVATDMVNGLLN